MADEILAKQRLSCQIKEIKPFQKRLTDYGGNFLKEFTIDNQQK